jgi:hypothetical protein
MARAGARASVLLAMLVVLVAPVRAQDELTVRVVRSAPVLQTPRGDAAVLGTLEAGTVIAVRGRQGAWLQVDAPAARAAEWKTGWIHAQDVEVVSGSLPPVASQAEARAPRMPGRRIVRGFVQAGGTLFSARDSFETILGSRFGPTFGAGGQVAFANGGFLELGVSRFRKTGSRVVVAPGQLFDLGLPHTVTVMPIELTAGYRVVYGGGFAAYYGLGAGWHRFEEKTPSLEGGDTRNSHVGYHAVAGVEYPVGPWIALAGEAQWAAVPGSLGDAGVSAAFEEEDLGGASFRFRILVGR